jgi:AcrR family transcriptional regulator
MPRIRKDAAVRRNEILDSAQRLVYAKGSEPMTIQDILDDLHISKGGFFHHFESKQDLLDGLLKRMLDQAVQALQPMVQDPTLTALQKLRRYFTAVSQLKTAQKSLPMGLLQAWDSDGKDVARQKRHEMYLERITPLITAMLRQGVAEGVFVASHPEQLCEILITLGTSMKAGCSKVLQADPPFPDALPRLKRLVGAYTEAIERVLGAPAGAQMLAGGRSRAVYDGLFTTL